jgi:hypothetical protein
MDASGCSRNNEKEKENILPVIYCFWTLSRIQFCVLNCEVIYEDLFQVPAYSCPHTIASAFGFPAGKRK